MAPLAAGSRDLFSITLASTSCPSSRLGSKRKLVHDSPSPPTQRRRTTPPCSSTPCPTKPASRKASTTPEPDSIYDILRRNCRSRLYVPPIIWTSDHVQLLNCKFTKKPWPGNKRDVSDSTTQSLRLSPTQCDTATSATVCSDRQLLLSADQLFKSCSMEMKKLVIRELLVTCGHRYVGSDRLPFRFDGHIVQTLQTDGVFSSDLALPSLAYIGLDMIRSIRQKSISLPNCGKRNIPVARVIEKKLRALEPSDEAHDPYILAILISLAQERWQRWQRDKSRDCASSFQVAVLVMPGIYVPKVCLYTAYIPSQFLDKLDKPSRFSPSPSVSVSYRHIPLAPPDKLIQALHRCLCVIQHCSLRGHDAQKEAV